MSNAKRHIQIPTNIKALIKLSFSKKLFTKNFQIFNPISLHTDGGEISRNKPTLKEEL